MAGQGTCIGTPEPSRCGFEQVEVEVDTPERFRCDEEDQTIGASIKAPVCCPPQLSCPYDRPIGLCHMVADAYDCRGNLLGSYCMDHYGWTGDYPGRYEADTGCVFDRWTVPCRWVIRRTGSVYDLKCGLTRPQVRYYCCEGPECARVYGRS